MSLNEDLNGEPMPWLLSKIYDGFMAKTEEACLEEWRTELLAETHGAVLEIGAGTGVNVPHYPDSVAQLVATEPDRHMRAVLKEKAPHVRLVDAPAEDLPFDDASFDYVVSTLVLCTVRSQEESLREIRRVLKPGGALIFLEHVESESEGRRKWQHRLEPVWSWAADNCHLTRDTASAIRGAGFDIETIQSESMRKALPIIRESIRGRAIKPEAAT